MHNSMVRPLMEKRVKTGMERPDLINLIIMKKEEWVGRLFSVPSMLNIS